MRTFICVTFYSRGENCDLQLYFPSEIATLKKTPHTEAYSNVWTQKGSPSIFRMLECYVKSSILKVKVFGGEYWNKDHQITGKYHICAGGWSSISLKLQRNTSIEDKPWLKQVLHESLSLTHRFRVLPKVVTFFIANARFQKLLWNCIFKVHWHLQETCWRHPSHKILDNILFQICLEIRKLSVLPRESRPKVDQARHSRQVAPELATCDAFSGFKLSTGCDLGYRPVFHRQARIL